MERPNGDPYRAPLADTANGVDRTGHQAYEQVNNPNFRDLAKPDATYCGASRHRSVNPPIDLSTQSQIVRCPGRVAIHTPPLVKPDSSQKRDTKLMEHTFPGDDGSVRERAPGPIHVVTAVFDEVVEPVAYTCLKLMLFREGASLIYSAHGRVQARPGTLLVVCAGTLCGGIPVRSVRVTTAYVNLDYLLDQLTWRLSGLLLDRHEAETIAAKSFRHNMWGTQLSSEVARHMAGLLDRVEQVQDEGGGFYAIEAPFIKVLEQLVPLLPYGDIPDGPVRSLAGEGTGGRFPPLRGEIRAVGRAVQADLARKWTLKDLAGIAHLSVRQLSRVFRESYELPPMSYVAMLRAKEMARLLRDEPDCSVEAVGRMVGWRGRSHARDKFTDLLGIGPDEYRRRARGLDLATPGPDTAETAAEGS